MHADSDVQCTAIALTQKPETLMVFKRHMGIQGKMYPKKPCGERIATPKFMGRRDRKLSSICGPGACVILRVLLGF